MSEQHDERLRAAARAWVAAADEVEAAAHAADDPAYVLELAERATLARLRLRQTLVDLGWTPPGAASPGHGPGTPQA